MSGSDFASKQDRPPLPRDAFRTHRSGTSLPSSAESRPVVVVPSYDESDRTGAEAAATVPARASHDKPAAKRSARPRPERNPFEAYGERSSSRPYAMRLPDAIDLVLRQVAAEERTHPLRVIDRILHDHLKRIGRLPPP